MDFTLLYTKNTQQAVVRHFKLNGTTVSKIMNLEEAKSSQIQGYIFAEDLRNDDFFSGLESEIKFYPIRSHTEFDLSLDRFEKLTYDDAKKVFDKMRENWILQNNISLIEEIFKVRNHLLSLWPNDRSGFFEELWFILKTNLGASSLTLLYNDMVKSKQESEKNKLIKVKVQGERYPELAPCDEMDERILKSYEKNFGNIFDITEYNKEKGQLVLCCNIKKSPILVMANIYQLTHLQKSLLSSLFEGLNL